jgi:dolichyl-phosphate beta-glucosyltransferase
MQSLSVVIPAFNESRRLEATIRRISEYLIGKKCEFEIIVVDDGSSDTTPDLVGTLGRSLGNISLVQNARNRGKGFSVRRGMAESSRELVLISDADLSTPVEEIEKFLPWIAQGYDIVIGSRALRESEILKKQPWYRQFMGRAFNLMVKSLVMGGIDDTQCGFKLLKSSAAKNIAGRMKIDRFAFDVEMLHLAGRMGCRVKEVPVRWVNSPQSRVRIFSDSARMFLDLLRIRFGAVFEMFF